MQPFEDIMRRGGSEATRAASRFFMQAGPVYESLCGIATRLRELGIPYAVIGGMALVAYGYPRTTEDIDILVSPAGLETVHRSLIGLGYRPLFEGSRNLRDTATGVRIEFVVTGQFPGDGCPKPVAFPDPDQAAIEIDGVRYVGLAGLVELKLASGMGNPGRIRDLADVQELIRALQLADDFADRLNPFVRSEFLRLASAIRGSEDHD